jgi:hypothetical protein
MKTLEEKQAWMRERMRQKAEGQGRRAQKSKSEIPAKEPRSAEERPKDEFVERHLEKLSDAIDELDSHLNKHHQRMSRYDVRRLGRLKLALDELLRDAEQKAAPCRPEAPTLTVADFPPLPAAAGYPGYEVSWQDCEIHIRRFCVRNLAIGVRTNDEGTHCAVCLAMDGSEWVNAAVFHLQADNNLDSLFLSMWQALNSNWHWIKNKFSSREEQEANRLDELRDVDAPAIKL